MTQQTLVIIAIIASAFALVTALVALRRSVVPVGDFQGGYVLELRPDGVLRETSIPASDLAIFATALPTRKRASVLTTGAAVLNVSVGVVRLGRRRDWYVKTVVPGVVTTVNQSITFSLAGTGVLEAGDAPDMMAGLDHHAIFGRYYMTEADRDHPGTLLVFPFNATMIFRPMITDYPAAPGIYPARVSPVGFDSFHANSTIAISAAFTWFVAE